MFMSLFRKTLSNTIVDIRQVPSYIRAASIHYSSSLLIKDHEEIFKVEDVERNMFESNSHNSSYVNAKDLLRQYTTKLSRNSRDRRHRKTETKNEVNTESADNASNTPFIQKKIVNKTPPELIIDEEIGFRYTKLQRNDQTLHRLLLKVKSKKYREIKHQLLLEGRRLIIDAIKCGLPLKYLIFSDLEQLKMVAKFAPKDVTCYKIARSDLSFWSTLTTTPGLMAIFEKPVDMSDIWKQKNHLPIIVICDQIREPNNIGGIIRTCASIPVEKIIMTKGCADHWDTKALRGGAGGQFLVPTVGPMSWESIYSILPPSYNVFVAENNVENAEKMLGSEMHERFVPYTDLPFIKNCVVVIGGETEGVSEEAYQLLKMNLNGSCVHIPLADGVDSLNTSTALAIVLFEIKKQMTELKRMKSQASEIR